MKRFFKAIWSGWKKFAHKLGVFNTKVLLTIVYFIVLGFVALFVHLLRKDFLNRQLTGLDTFWDTRPETIPNLDEAKRQF